MADDFSQFKVAPVQPRKSPRTGVLQVQYNGKWIDVPDEEAAPPTAAPDDFSQFKPAEVPKAPAERPKSFVQGVGEGALNVLNHGARWAEAGLNQLGGAGDVINQWGAEHLGTAPNAAAAEADQQRRLDARPVQASGLGKFVGETAATLPLGAVRGGVLAQGALTGALMSDSEGAGGVLRDAGVAAGAGFLGNAAMRGLGRAVAPVVNPVVQRLIDAGVPLTPGQIVGQGGVSGRAVKRLEDSVSNLPLIGTSIRSARARGNDALNRAAVNRALAPIGETLPADVEIGHAAVAHAGDRLSAAYTDVLPQLRGVVDNQFQRRFAAISGRAALPPEYQPQVAQLVQEVGRAFTQNPGANGQFTGRTLRDATDRIDKLASAWRANPNDPYLRTLGDTAQQLREQLFALAARQNPGAATRLRAINRGYASLVRVEKAAAGTSDGAITPGSYKTATRTADRSVRKRATARGQALDQDLSSAAATVMPSTVGEGGSNAVNGLALMGALGAGAAGGSMGALGVVAGGTAGSLLYTQPGQRAAQWLLARPTGQISRNAAGLIRAGAPVAGQAAAVAPSVISSSLDK